MWSLIRYADDMVLICRSKTKAEQALRIIGQLLEGLQLTLHPTKTRWVAMEREGFDFLGFHLNLRRHSLTLPLRRLRSLGLRPPRIRGVVNCETVRHHHESGYTL